MLLLRELPLCNTNQKCLPSFVFSVVSVRSLPDVVRCTMTLLSESMNFSTYAVTDNRQLSELYLLLINRCYAVARFFMSN